MLLRMFQAAALALLASAIFPSITLTWGQPYTVKERAFDYVVIGTDKKHYRLTLQYEAEFNTHSWQTGSAKNRNRQCHAQVSQVVNVRPVRTTLYGQDVQLADDALYRTGIEFPTFHLEGIGQLNAFSQNLDDIFDLNLSEVSSQAQDLNEPFRRLAHRYKTKDPLLLIQTRFPGFDPDVIEVSLKTIDVIAAVGEVTLFQLAPNAISVIAGLLGGDSKSNCQAMAAHINGQFAAKASQFGSEFAGIAPIHALSQPFQIMSKWRGISPSTGEVVRAAFAYPEGILPDRNPVSATQFVAYAYQTVLDRNPSADEYASALEDAYDEGWTLSLLARLAQEEFEYALIEVRDELETYQRKISNFPGMTGLQCFLDPAAEGPYTFVGISNGPIGDGLPRAPQIPVLYRPSPDRPLYDVMLQDVLQVCGTGCFMEKDPETFQFDLFSKVFDEMRAPSGPNRLDHQINRAQRLAVFSQEPGLLENLRGYVRTREHADTEANAYMANYMNPDYMSYEGCIRRNIGLPH